MMGHPDRLRLSFHGAAREVTGSCHLVETGGRRLLLDCGMIQGGKERHERNREPFPFDPAAVDAVLLSHAHIDHTGRLPLLVARGFRGPILTTEASAALARVLLLDSARIHEEDARWKIKRLKKKGEDHSWVTALFTEEDARATLERLEPVPFDEPVPLPGIGAVRFVKAGHILGAAIVELTLEGGRRLVFSGDLGVDGARLLGPPQAVERPDWLLIESTYGDRNRDDGGDRTERLLEVIRRTTERGGKVVIPSFAVGRTQELLARINDLVESGRLSGLPIYVDSPMAVEATGIFAHHPEAYSAEARRLLRAGDEPLAFTGLALSSTVAQSKAINGRRGPAVIISASGMCTAGRVKHHLRHNLADPNATVLFVGYQAHGSLGRLIQSGVDPIRIFGDWYPVRATVETIEGFSAHADLDELLRWFEGLGGVPRRTFVVHGEESAALSFAARLRERYSAEVSVPSRGEAFDVD
jgi:metallo-beta-lactamase family protein